MSDETTTTEGAPAAPEHALDEVAVVLRRAFPDPVSKVDLQEQTGLGTDDLRGAIAVLEERGDLYGKDEGYAWAAEGLAQPSEDRLAELVPDEPVTPAEPGEHAEEGLGELFTPERAQEAAEAAASGKNGGQPAAAAGATRYEVAIVLEVGFYAELAEGETEDAAAAREALDLGAMARTAVNDAYPDLPVTARVVKLTAFDTPRSVFPTSKG